MSEAKPLKDWLSGLEVLSPVTAGRLQVFGLRHPSSGRLDYLTLDEALDSKAFEVTEVDEGGEVPTLKVSNKGDSMVFIMAGEELVGAKQNRVLNVSLMVAGKSEIPVPVSCVESGRWRYRSPKFSSGGFSSHGKLRAKMAKHMAQSYRRGGRPSSDQGEVWEEVSSKLAFMQSASNTEALHQVYEDHENTLREMREKLRVPEECCGVVFAYGGKIVGVDVFDKPSTLRKLWPKLTRSYAIDAMEETGEKALVAREAVCEWLERAGESDAAEYKSPGLGDDLRVESNDLVGGSLIVERQPVHTELFTALN